MFELLMKTMEKDSLAKVVIDLITCFVGEILYIALLFILCISTLFNPLMMKIFPQGLLGRHMLTMLIIIFIIIIIIIIIRCFHVFTFENCLLIIHVFD